MSHSLSLLLLLPVTLGWGSHAPEQIAVPGSGRSAWIDAKGGEEFVRLQRADGSVTEPKVMDRRLHLRGGAFDPLAELADQAAWPDLDPAQTRLLVVQYQTPILEEYAPFLAALGAEVVGYLPHHAHIVRTDAAGAELTRLQPFVRWVGEYAPQWRMESALQAHAASPDESTSPILCNLLLTGSSMALKHAVAEALRALGAEVVRENAGKSLLEAWLSPAQVAAAARMDSVLFIDRWTPMEVDMDLARQVGGATVLETVHGFDGAGIVGEVIDVGFNLSHVDFASRPLILHTTVGSDSHGAATSGIIFGDGTGSAVKKGLLPEGQGIVASFNEINVGVPRYEHTGELVQPPYEALFQSSSVGSTRTIEYTTISADHDAMLFDFDIVHCQSQSNAGNQLSRPQAWAKNVVSIGGINHQGTLSTADDCWGCGSTAASIGPANDGRIKPDLSHFYDLIGTVSTGSNNAYTESFGGTSGATPIVAGYFGLFFEMWHEGIFGNEVDPLATPFENRCHMTTAKAMLVNTAKSYTFGGTGVDLTRTHQGWGFPDAQRLFDEAGNLFIIDESVILQNLAQASWPMTVGTGESELRVTLVYADPPGNPAAAVHRVNDLTLRVTSPSGTIYWGNNGLLAGNWSTPGGSPNTIDTVENVFLFHPEAGVWTIDVIASEVNADSHVETSAVDADFALVVLGAAAAPAALEVEILSEIPQSIDPGVPTQLIVRVAAGDQGIVPGSPSLHWRGASGDAFDVIPLIAQGGDEYLAELPAAACVDEPEFYVSAQGDGGAVVTDPISAPAVLHRTAVGEFVTAFSDNGESSAGWSVTNQDLLAGAWARGVPAGTGLRGDPPSDADGSGSCWTTGLGLDDDLDGGPTILLSPIFSAEGLVDPVLSWQRWFTCDDAGNSEQEQMTTELSNNGGASWTIVDVGGSVTQWRSVVVAIEDVMTPTAQMRLRFTATDQPNNSVTEAAIDAIRLTATTCTDPDVPGDVNGDGEVGFDDLLAILSAWGPCGAPCDEDLNGDGEVGFDDVLEVLANWT